MSRLFNATSNNFLSVSDNLGLLDQPFTVAFYVKHLTIPSTHEYYFDYQNDTTTPYGYLVQKETANLLRARSYQGSGRNADTTTSITQDSWELVICTFTDTNASRIEALGDDVTETANTTYQLESSPELHIGSTDSGVLVMDGKIAHFTVWNVELSTADKILLQDGDIPNTVNSGNITRDWDFDTDSLTDAVGGITLIETGTVLYDSDMPILGTAVLAVDSPVIFGEQDVDITTSGFTNPNSLDGLTIQDVTTGNHLLDLSASLIGTAGVYTFDLTDVAAAVANALGTPLDSSSHTHIVTISDSIAVESASVTIVVNPSAGYYGQELTSVIGGAGTFVASEGWFLPLPADQSQVMYASAENVNDTATDYFNINALGEVDTNLLSGSVSAVFFDITGELSRGGQFEDAMAAAEFTFSDAIWQWTASGLEKFAGGDGDFYQLPEVALVTGGTYEFVYTIVDYTVGTATIGFGGGAGVNGTARSANGTHTETITAIAASSVMRIKPSAAARFTVSSFSVKRTDVPGGIWKPFTIIISEGGIALRRAGRKLYSLLANR